MNYIKRLSKRQYRVLIKEEDGYYRASDEKSYQECMFAFRIFENIKKIKLQKIKNDITWTDVEKYIEKIKLNQLPNQASFNNDWLKNLCTKYEIFNIKINIFKQNIKKEKIQLENDFFNYCNSLNITKIGNNYLSIYVGMNYPINDKENMCTYFYPSNNQIFLESWQSFTHEWAHFLDFKAYSKDWNFISSGKMLKFMTEYNYSKSFYSELISYNTKITSKKAKYYSLYKVMKHMIYDKNKIKPSKFYQLCKNYHSNYHDKEYFYKEVEIFARTFEVCLKKILGTHNFLDTERYDWKIYPSQKEVFPIEQDLKKFIQQITSDL